MCYRQLTRVDHMWKKKQDHEEEPFFSKSEYRTPGHDWQATASRCPALALSDCGPLFYFLIFFWFFWESLRNGPCLLREWVYNTPIFLTLPLHLELWNLSFLMELEDFIFSKIRIYLDLHIHCCDFSFMKKWNHK